MYELFFITKYLQELTRRSFPGEVLLIFDTRYMYMYQVFCN